MIIDLAFIWAGIIAFAVLAYVLLDGFDLGIGILFPFMKKGEERDTAITSVAPVWDGNETWLVMGGGGLLAVFPLAYATILPALYLPLITMLLGLVFRGVAFEFRWRTEKWRWVWDISFIMGSYVTTFCQGVVLGALVEGLNISDRAYQGGSWDWFSPFSMATGVALVFGYAMLGATWLVMKTEHSLEEKSRHMAFVAGGCALLFIGLVSLWTPFLREVYFERWFAMPAMLYSAPVPLAILACVVIGLRDLLKGTGTRAFLAANGLFILCFVGLGISFYPYIVPGALTIWDAAAPPESLGFLIVGSVVMIPIILAYTAYSYWVFRGKTRLSDYAHH